MSATAVVLSRERVAAGAPARDASQDRPPSALWDRFFERRDSGSRATLTEAYLSLVRYVVARMKPLLPDYLERDNLVQYGVFGLVDAIDRFQPSRGVRFETFAVPRIKGAILDAVRSNDWAPRSVRAREKELALVSAGLEARLKRSPTTDEILTEMGITRPAFESLRLQVAQGRIGELDQRDADLVPDDSTDPAAAYERTEELQILRRCIASLPEREQQVLALYYFDELTLKQIGEVLGVTEGWVCKIHAKAIQAILGKMREAG
ncbi:MAG: sigma-70 family RNA polymerase sigma factor [Acidimicrobiales bacterium]